MMSISKAATLARPAAKGPNSVLLYNTVSLAIVSLVSISILSGWLIADLSVALPEGWWGMQASAALCILLLALGLLLPYRRQVHLLLGRQSSGAAAILLAGLSQLDGSGIQAKGLSSLLVTDSLLPLVQPMSAQSAVCFVLLGASLLIEPSRDGLGGLIIDGQIMLLVILNLIFVSGYLFNASELVGVSKQIRISPQTLICMGLLTTVLAVQRAPYGFLSVLLGAGIGSRIARTLLPLSVLASYLIILGGESLQAAGLLTKPNAEAVTASCMAILMISVIILLARKINLMERGLRNMSMTDELTGLQNLRGFYQLGDLALSEAREQGHPAQMLFFDVDGLKLVNDTLGHEVGSQLLTDFARLLKATFRGSDIVGRVGGDEFAVFTSGRHHDMFSALQRLEEATVTANAAGNRPYLVSYSVGSEAVEPQGNRSFHQILTHADAAMYRHKRQKRIKGEIRVLAEPDKESLSAESVA